jgi:hypothetical protein
MANNTNIKNKQPVDQWKLYHELMAWYEKVSKHGASPSTRYHLLAEVNHQLNHCPMPEPGMEQGDVFAVGGYKPTTSHSPPNPFRK